MKKFNVRDWLSMPLEQRLVLISNAIKASGGFKK